MAKFKLSEKVASAIGIGHWASEQDVIAHIHRLDDRIIDGAIQSGRLDPGLREWARSNFSAFKEFVKSVPAGGLAQLARHHAAETGVSLDEAQRAVVRHNPDLYNARIASRVVTDDERRSATIRHAAGQALATLTRTEYERQGGRSTLDEARRIVFSTPAHAPLVHQYATGMTDMLIGVPPDGAATGTTTIKVKTETVPTAAEQLAKICEVLGLPEGSTSDDVQRVLEQWGKPGGKGGSGQTFPK